MPINSPFSILIMRSFSSLLKSRVKFQFEDFLGKIYKVEALEGENLMNSGIIAKVPFQKACGGNAECTTCHVYVPKEVRQH